MINDRLRHLIHEKFKADIVYPQQCEALSLAIEEATGQSLSTTTLKRMLGFVKGSDRPRLSSLDILARYLGYANYRLLAKDIDDTTEISEFRAVESIESSSLEIGDRIMITYHPGRKVIMSYLGDNRFIVNESHGCKLVKGDKPAIKGFYVGFKLIVSDVERAGKHLGSYVAAKQGGLVSIKII